MSLAAQFPRVSRTDNPSLDLTPRFQTRLARNGIAVDVVAPVDSGTPVSVVPFDGRPSSSPSTCSSPAPAGSFEIQTAAAPAP